MMKNKVIIFMVEGPSDEEALVIPLENELVSKKIRVKTKVLHTDILTKYSDREKFETTTSNVVSKVKAIIEDFFNKFKYLNLKYKDIGKIIYVTDTDNCFFKDAKHSQNKKECLKVLFYIKSIFLGKRNAGNDNF